MGDTKQAKGVHVVEETIVQEETIVEVEEIVENEVDQEVDNSSNVSFWVLVAMHFIQC